MKRQITICLMAVLLMVGGCAEEGPVRLDDYFVEFATVVRDGGLAFRLDNGEELIPQSTDYAGKNGQRVMLNYTRLDGQTISINFVHDIHTGEIDSENFEINYRTEPVKIQSVWVSGGYLNMILEVDFHSAPHKIGLFKPYATGDLYFSHSLNGDPPGAPTMLYASFILDGLKEHPNDLLPPFRLHINTYDGMRIIEF